MNVAITVHDLTSDPCSCSHEEKWREEDGNVFTVTSAIRKCLSARCGMNLWCTHATAEAKLLPIDGRRVLFDRMKTLATDWDRKIFYHILPMNNLYKLKHLLDALKRKACGWNLTKDLSPEQILMWLFFLDESDPLRGLFYVLVPYVKNPPKTPQEIRDFDLLFSNADKLICSRINEVLKQVQAVS